MQNIIFIFLFVLQDYSSAFDLPPKMAVMSLKVNVSEYFEWYAENGKELFGWMSTLISYENFLFCCSSYWMNFTITSIVVAVFVITWKLILLLPLLLNDLAPFLYQGLGSVGKSSSLLKNRYKYSVTIGGF